MMVSVLPTLAASTAFAESERGRDHDSKNSKIKIDSTLNNLNISNGLGIGRGLKGIGQEIKELKSELKSEIKDLSSTPQGPQEAVRILPNGNTRISGANIDAMNGSTLTLGILGLKFTVDASNAKITPGNAALADLRVGDQISVDGKINGNTGIITAITINDYTLRQRNSGGNTSALQQRINELLALVARLQAQLQQILGGIPSQAPIISSVSASNISETSATITWTTNQSATSKVYFGTSSPLNTSTASSTTDGTLVTNHSILLAGLIPSTTYFFIVESANASNKVSQSSQFSLTTSAHVVTPPVISGITTANVSSTNATIQWSTNVLSTSKVYFGITSPVNLPTASTTADNTLVTNHSVGLAGLSASTTYFFVVESKDATNDIATSTQQSFTTFQ